jgi:5-methylcytosine-specific restriction endonuclease McrA
VKAPSGAFFLANDDKYSMSKKIIETEEERYKRMRSYDRKYISNPENKLKRYLKNKETQSERWKRWYEKNKSKQLAKFNMEKAARLQRIPSWANLDAIKEFYLNRPEGHHVDHIVPLRGKEVSGLHVLENLQYLPAKENLSKGNKYTS